MAKKYKSILCISDLHFPYTHKDCFPYLKALIKKYKPDCFVLLGDELDYHAMSFHDSDPDLDSAGKELQKALGYMETLYKVLGKKDVYVLESNHGSMAYRKGKHHGIPRHLIKSYKEVLNAPDNWSWHSTLKIKMSNGEDCKFAHGYKKNVLANSKDVSCNFIQGHHHSTADIQYWSTDDDQYFFGATIGCMIDDISYAYAYNKITPNRPILNHLILEEGVPKLLPMKLNKSKRWNKVVP